MSVNSSDAVPQVFISYRRVADDMAFCDRLVKQLKPSNIAHFVDHQLYAGDHIDEKIKLELDRANVFICLLSADFLEPSDAKDARYIWDVERPAIARKIGNRSAILISVLNKPVAVLELPISEGSEHSFNDYLFGNDAALPAFSTNETDMDAVAAAVAREILQRFKAGADLPVADERVHSVLQPLQIHCEIDGTIVRLHTADREITANTRFDIAAIEACGDDEQAGDALFTQLFPHDIHKEFGADFPQHARIDLRIEVSDSAPAHLPWANLISSNWPLCELNTKNQTTGAWTVSMQWQEAADPWQINLPPVIEHPAATDRYPALGNMLGELKGKLLTIQSIANPAATNSGERTTSIRIALVDGDADSLHKNLSLPLTDWPGHSSTETELLFLHLPDITRSDLPDLQRHLCGYPVRLIIVLTREVTNADAALAAFFKNWLQKYHVHPLTFIHTYMPAAVCYSNFSNLDIKANPGVRVPHLQHILQLDRSWRRDIDDHCFNRLRSDHTGNVLCCVIGNHANHIDMFPRQMYNTLTDVRAACSAENGIGGPFLVQWPEGVARARPLDLQSAMAESMQNSELVLAQSMALETHKTGADNNLLLFAWSGVPVLDQQALRLLADTLFTTQAQLPPATLGLHIVLYKLADGDDTKTAHEQIQGWMRNLKKENEQYVDTTDLLFIPEPLDRVDAKDLEHYFSNNHNDRNSTDYCSPTLHDTLSAAIMKRTNGVYSDVITLLEQGRFDTGWQNLLDQLEKRHRE